MQYLTYGAIGNIFFAKQFLLYHIIGGSVVQYLQKLLYFFVYKPLVPGSLRSGLENFLIWSGVDGMLA